MSELSFFLDSISLEDTHATPHEDIYHLLLRKQQHQSTSTISRLIPPQTPPSPPPVNTINPQQLGSSYTSTPASTSSCITLPRDSASVSSLDEDDDQLNNHDHHHHINHDLDSHSNNDSYPPHGKKSPRMSWAMNDEFHRAIQTWLTQNEKQHAKYNKRNSISEPSNIIRTSLTKRRKSDSSVAFMRPPLSTINSSNHNPIPVIPSVSQPTTKQSTPSLNSTEEDDSEEKPFKCDSCTKAFRRSEHLKRHIRSVHSNIRPFPCRFCDKKFSRSDNLAQHLRTHNKH